MDFSWLSAGLGLAYVAAGQVINHYLGTAASEPLKSAVAGFIGNRADWLACFGVRSIYNHLKQIRGTDPAVNHDLQIAARRAFLNASLELASQTRKQANAFDKPLHDAMARMIEAIQSELHKPRIPEEPLTDLHLLTLDEDMAPAERLATFRQSIRQQLDHDLVHWTGLPEILPAMRSLIDTGWQIKTRSSGVVERRWFDLVAIGFIEELKTSERVRAIFQSQLLAKIAEREPATAPIATTEAFAARFDELFPHFERLEMKVDAIQVDVAEIRTDVAEIRKSFLSRPRTRWAAIALASAAAIAALVIAQRSGTTTIVNQKSGHNSANIQGAKADRIEINIGASEKK